MKLSWQKASLIAFLGGFILVGGLDLFHTALGVQKYLIDFAVWERFGWPWYLPVQMGVAGLSLYWSWRWMRRVYIDKRLPITEGQEPDYKLVISMSLSGVLIGYIGGYLLVDEPNHMTWYWYGLAVSMIILIFFFSRQQMLAFLLTGISGVIVETILLLPEIGYFEYPQHDLFGHAPAWLPFVYGWVGIFIHQLTRWSE